MLSLKNEYQEKKHGYVFPLKETRTFNSDLSLNFTQTYVNQNDFFKNVYFRPELIYVYTNHEGEDYMIGDCKKYVPPDRSLLQAIRDGSTVYVEPGTYNRIYVEFFDSDLNPIDIGYELQCEWADLYTF